MLSKLCARCGGMIKFLDPQGSIGESTYHYYCFWKTQEALKELGKELKTEPQPLPLEPSDD